MYQLKSLFLWWPVGVLRGPGWALGGSLWPWVGPWGSFAARVGPWVAPLGGLWVVPGASFGGFFKIPNWSFWYLESLALFGALGGPLGVLGGPGWALGGSFVALGASLGFLFAALGGPLWPGEPWGGSGLAFW